MNNMATLWYGGLAFAGERPLTGDEMASLRVQVRALNRNAIVTLGLCGLAFVVIGFGFLHPWLLLVGVPILLVAGKMTERSEGITPFASNLRRDAKRGVAHMARGTIGDLVVADLINMGDRDEDPIAIDVLPHSGLVLARNGRPTLYEILVPIKTTSLIPERAGMAANFVRPTSDEDVFTHQRPLTEEEARELDVYAPRAGFTMWVLTAVLAVTWITILTLSIAGRAEPALALYGAIPVVLVAQATWSRWRKRRQIAADLVAAFVVIVRRRENGDLTPPQEYLPYSGILWTSNGSPAHWRRFG